MHLLIPFAGASADARQLDAMELPFMARLLRRMEVTDSDTATADSLSPPHERALARLRGLSTPDGCIPWAALQAGEAGHGAGAWAWISPTHWDVGTDHITMADPQALDLQEVESRALLQAMAPFFSGDGMTLQYATPGRWLARGDIFERLPSASLDRVAGRDIGAWMPAAPVLRRLQNEMQMLLYTHAVNDTRSARGLPAVNSFWVSGTGSLSQAPVRESPADLHVAEDLRAAALRADWEAWEQAWHALDGQHCRALLQSLDAGVECRLTLCGDRNALTLAPVGGGPLARLRRRFERTTFSDLHGQL